MAVRSDEEIDTTDDDDDVVSWDASKREDLVSTVGPGPGPGVGPGPGDSSPWPIPSPEVPDDASSCRFAASSFAVNTDTTANPDDNWPRILIASAQSPMRR